MNLPTLNFCSYPIFFIIINLCLFYRCTNELDDCFFLTQDKVKRQYDLNAFDTVKSSLKGKYIFKQGKEYQIEISGYPRYIDSLSKQVY